MADKTPIEWTDATANVINGCSLASPGCTNCYAMKQAHRTEVRRGLTMKSKGGMVWTGEVSFHEPALLKVLSWRRPRKIFWNAHGDMFHPNVPDEWIDRCFAVMALTPQHIHQVLTKRADRMRAYISGFEARPEAFGEALASVARAERLSKDAGLDAINDMLWPLPNVWLGASVEDQARADERIPDLLSTPAAVRWLSMEPLLGAVDLSRICLVAPVKGSGRAGIHIDVLRGRYVESGMPYIGAWDIDEPYPTEALALKLNWIVPGGESGRGARPMRSKWARDLWDQCDAAQVAFLFKQHGEWIDRDQIGWLSPTAYCSDEFRQVRSGDDTWEAVRIGKKAAGRLLDGVQHDGFPKECIS